MVTTALDQRENNNEDTDMISSREAASLLGVDQEILATWTETGFIREYMVRSGAFYRHRDILKLQGRLLG